MKTWKMIWSKVNIRCLKDFDDTSSEESMF